MSTTVNVTGDASLSPLMQTYYDKLFLSYGRPTLKLHQFGQKRKLPAGEGKTVHFTRYSRLDKASGALSEGVNPATSTQLSATTVSATVGIYGNYSKISSLLSLTSVDPKMKSAVELHSLNAMETVDWLINDECRLNAGKRFVNGKAGVSAVAASDTLSTGEVRLAVRELKKKNAMKLDGYFIGVIDPDTVYDIQGDSAWVNAANYAGGAQLFEGEVGKWMGVRFVESTEPYVYTGGGAGGASVHANFIFGKEAYGVVDLDGGASAVIVKRSGAQDTSNPLDMYWTVGWKCHFAPKVLNSQWITAIHCGVTA